MLTIEFNNTGNLIIEMKALLRLMARVVDYQGVDTSWEVDVSPLKGGKVKIHIQRPDPERGTAFWVFTADPRFLLPREVYGRFSQVGLTVEEQFALRDALLPPKPPKPMNLDPFNLVF